MLHYLKSNEMYNRETSQRIIPIKYLRYANETSNEKLCLLAN